MYFYKGFNYSNINDIVNRNIGELFMTTIGAAWQKQNDDGKFYYSLSFDEAIMPFQIDSTKRFAMRENKNKGYNEKAPDFYIDAYIPDPNKNKKEE